MTCKCVHLSGQLSSILTLFGWHCAVFQHCLAADREIPQALLDSWQARLVSLWFWNLPNQKISWSEPVDSAGVSVIKAFHVPRLKGEREREGEKALAGTLCSLFTLSLTNLVHRWPTIISLCAHCRWRATSFSEIGVILYYLWLSRIFGSRLNTICWITERSARQQSGMKCKQREWKWRSQGIHNEDVMLTVRRTAPESSTL